jgi:hypothetical protein
MLLPLISAGLGGYEAYRRTGGDLGATALGTGLGLVTPGALRMAGTALGARLVGTELAARGAAGLTGQAAKLAGIAAEAGGGLKGAAAAEGANLLTKAGAALLDPKKLGALAAGTGVFLGAPALAGGLASKAAGPARGAAQVGAGTVGYQAPGEVDYSGIGGGAVPPVGTFGAGGTLSDPLNVLGRVGMAQRLETLKSAEAQRDAMRLMMPELFKAAEARSKTEFQRQMAAAGVRQNILTAANMLERSQQAAQQMGLTAASQAGSALTSQYQYS